MSRLKINAPPGSKWGEEILAWALPVVLFNRVLGRDADKILANLRMHTPLPEDISHRQHAIAYDQMVNANTKRVLKMSYGMASKVKGLPETVTRSVEVGLADECGRSAQLVTTSLVRAGIFIDRERHVMAELNAWKMFFSEHISGREYDAHDISEYDIGRYLP